MLLHDDLATSYKQITNAPQKGNKHNLTFRLISFTYQINCQF